MRLLAGMCSLMAMLVAGVCPAGDAETGKAAETIKLSQPDTDKGMPVMKALKNRKSERDYSAKKLSHRQLSDLAWATNGVNRKGGKRTWPSAANVQSVDLYVVTEEAVYLYDSRKHELNPVVSGDHRKHAGTQGFVHRAPVNLVFVSDLSKFGGRSSREKKILWASIAAGCQTQNAALYCASEGLGNVVREWIKREDFAKLVGLRPDQEVIIAQTVGIPKKKD